MSFMLALQKLDIDYSKKIHQHLKSIRIEAIKYTNACD